MLNIIALFLRRNEKLNFTFRIQKRNGKVFILKVCPVKRKPGTFQLKFRECRFLSRWKLIGFTNNIKDLRKTILYHFGFKTIIDQIP